MLKKLKTIVLIIFVGIPLFIIALPILLFFIPTQYYLKKQLEKKYTTFLDKNNGKNFFCYNNRKKSKNYLEKDIIPNLTGKIEIIYLNGKNVEANQDAENIAQTLLKLKNYTKFPHLIKIREKKLIDKSINNSFYNVLNLNKPKNELLNQINHFFET